MLFGAATASALSTGVLYGQGCISDTTDSGDVAGCGAALPTLAGAVDVAVSPDDKSVYVTSPGDNAIVRFDRNTANGAITPQGCFADAAGCGPPTAGLAGAEDVTVSPDNKSVYVASDTDDAIVRFNRDT